MSNATTHIKTEKQLVPVLRFNEFEGDWSKEKAGELCDCIVPGRNKPKQFDGEIAWITTPDIVHSSYIFNSKNGLGISKEEAKSVGSKIAPKNSVIISCVGDLGLVAIAGVELVINQQLHAFLPSEKVEYRFLMYSITTQGRYIDRVATKTAVPYMNKNNCNSIPVFLPQYPEQQKIASFLSAVDEKIQQLTKKKELLEQYKKGGLQQLFSGQLRFKDENGNPYPDWEEKRLGLEVTEYKEKSKVNDEYEVLTSSNKGLMLQSEYYGENRLTERDNLGFNIVPENHITFRSRSDNRKFTFNLNNLGLTGVISTYYPVFKSTNGSSFFIVEMLNYNQNFIGKYSVGTSQTVLSMNELKRIKFKFPCSEEQQKIATYLSRIDTKIESVNNQITQTQTFKKGLLQQMFVAA